MAHGGEALTAKAGARSGGLPGEEERLEFARWLFAQECRFVAGAASGAAMPEASAPEVAFAGRSNVGKSSLVNALTGRKTLARVSITPGRTRQLNFFLLGGRLLSASAPALGMAGAVRWFILVWLVAAAVNLWIGVTRAGYSVAEEAPIFVVVFAVPAAVALLVAWALTR